MPPILVVGGEIEAIALFGVIVVLGAVVFVLGRCGFMSSASDKAPAKAAAPAPREYTLAELAPHTGADGTRILVAVNGVVFDMGATSTFYGPGCAYNVFAGRDASFGLATMELDNSKWSARELTPSEADVLTDWYNRFTNKYPIVGALVEGSRPMTLKQLRDEGLIPAQ